MSESCALAGASANRHFAGMNAPLRALIVVPPGFEEIETVTPVDLLRRAGVEVTVAALAGTTAVTGRCGLTLVADTLFTEAHVGPAWDAVVLPGGPGHQALRADARVLELARRQSASGRVLAAICAAPTVLLSAGVLAGRTYTAHPSVAAELPALLVGRPVVADGNLITSRGAGTAVEFGLALIAALRGRPVAEEVARAICFTPA